MLAARRAFGEAHSSRIGRFSLFGCNTEARSTSRNAESERYHRVGLRAAVSVGGLGLRIGAFYRVFIKNTVL